MPERGQLLAQSAEWDKFVSLNNFNFMEIDGMEAFSHAFSSIEGTEAIVGALWKVVLNLPQLGPDESLSELGATSVQAAELLLRISRTFERQLPFTAILDHPSVRAMAGWLHESSTSQPKKAELLGAERSSAATRAVSGELDDLSS